MLDTSSAVHPALLQRFQALIQNNRLGHAYLFIGPRFVGKAETALAVAQLLNCEKNADGGLKSACGSCPPCRKIELKQHPDVALIDAAADEESIKIAAIREVSQRLHLKAYEGRKKVVIIKEAELMTAESGSAFLKTLEEPPKDTVIILTTSSPELLLPTVKSRCQQVYFFPMERERVAAALEGENLEKMSAHFLAGFSEGCLGRARQLAREDFISRKNELIDQLVLTKNNDRFLKGLLSDKIQVREALEVLLVWFRDLIFVKAKTEADQITNADRVKDLQEQERRYSFGQLDAIVSGIEEGLRLLDENLNFKIAFYLLMEKIWAR